MGLFSQDRPRIPGDPPHLEIMTKIGHALPNAARKTLAASAFIGKGRIKDAVRVMKRKSIPKIEEGIVEKIKKWNASGKKRTRYDGNDPYEDAPKQDIKKTMKEEQIDEVSSELAKKAAGKIQSKLTKKFDDADDGVPKDEHTKRLMRMSVRTKNAKYNDAVNKSRRKLDEGVVRKLKRAVTNWATKQDLEAKMSKETDFHDKKHRLSKLTPDEWKKKDPARSKAIKRITTLGKRQSAMHGGNIFMPSWPKKPGDLKYMTKKLKEGWVKKDWEKATDAHLELKKKKKEAKKEHPSAASWKNISGDKKLDEGIVKKISRAFNKATGIQRRGLDHAINKQYKNNEKRLQDYSDIAYDAMIDHNLAGRKSQAKRNTWKYYEKKEEERRARRKTLEKRSSKVNNAGKELDEAVSRRLIAKKNATKQRVKYTKVKGELPPIMKTKARYSITNKETNQLRGIIDKQRKNRKEVRDEMMEKKKGFVPVKKETGTDLTTAASTVFAKTPGGHQTNAQPHVTDAVRAHQTDKPKSPKSSKEDDLLRGFGHWSGEYARTGDQKYHDFAKKAALAHYAAMIAKISHYPGHPDYEDVKYKAKTMLDSHMDALKSIETHVPKKPSPLVSPNRKGFLGRLFSKKKSTD